MAHTTLSVKPRKWNILKHTQCPRKQAQGEVSSLKPVSECWSCHTGELLSHMDMWAVPAEDSCPPRWTQHAHHLSRTEAQSSMSSSLLCLCFVDSGKPQVRVDHRGSGHGWTGRRPNGDRHSHDHDRWQKWPFAKVHQERGNPLPAHHYCVHGQGHWPVVARVTDQW